MARSRYLASDGVYMYLKLINMLVKNYPKLTLAKVCVVISSQFHGEFNNRRYQLLNKKYRSSPSLTTCFGVYTNGNRNSVAYNFLVAKTTTFRVPLHLCNYIQNIFFKYIGNLKITTRNHLPPVNPKRKEKKKNNDIFIETFPRGARPIGRRRIGQSP